MNKYIDENDVYSPEGRDLLARIVTSINGQVYAIRPEAPSNVIGMALARLSRSPLDFRTLLLKEFSYELEYLLDVEITEATGPGSRTHDLGLRVIGEYGDDSVQQLIPVQVIFERVSNVVIKDYIEWGRLMGYLEQSTRYIPFNQKIDGKYMYEVPDIDILLREKYCLKMDEIFEIYSDYQEKMKEYYQDTIPQGELTDSEYSRSIMPQVYDSIRGLLPASVQSTVGVVGNAQSIEQLIIRLFSSNTIECTELAWNLYDAASEVAGFAFTRTIDVLKGFATAQYLNDIKTNTASFVYNSFSSDEALPPVRIVNSNLSGGIKQTLSEAICFEHNRSPQSVRNITEDFHCLEVIHAAIDDRKNRRMKPSRAIEDLNFTFDITCDFGIYRDLQRHRMVDGFRHMPFSPANGFEVHPDIIAAGLDEEYISAVHGIERLYSEIHRADYTEEAQYATLLCHNVNFRFTANLRELIHLIELRTGENGHSGYRKICNLMHDILIEEYPVLDLFFEFVDKRTAEEIGLARANEIKRADSKKAKQRDI